MIIKKKVRSTVNKQTNKLVTTKVTEMVGY